MTSKRSRPIEVEEPAAPQIIISHRYPEARRKHLESRGVHRLDMLGAKSFPLKKALCGYQVQNPLINISPIKQLAAATKFFADPLGAYSIMGVSSFPSDLKAKQLAISMMNAATDAWTAKRRESNSVPPLWHHVVGGLGNPLIDRRGDTRPCFIVLSNIAINSSDYKVEKVRDILEIYKGTPILLVISGTNPIEFFHRRLYYPIEMALHIGNGNSLLPDDL